MAAPDVPTALWRALAHRTAGSMSASNADDRSPFPSSSSQSIQVSYAHAPHSYGISIPHQAFFRRRAIDLAPCERDGAIGGRLPVSAGADCASAEEKRLMDPWYFVCGSAAVLLMGYLFFAMMKPEFFE